MARMRRKKNIVERTALCADHWFQVPVSNRGKWREACKMPSSPLYVELGCGKGKFATEMALRHPDVCYIAFEKEPSVCLLAMEKAVALEIPNLYFVCGDATMLQNFFAPDEIDRLFINFCDPWSKKKKPKRRLTYRGYLSIYRELLAPGKQLHFKTDDDRLFEFSLEELQSLEAEISCLTYDLHHSEWNDENIRTEFETKFAEAGIPIKRVVASFR
ncbi:MAG TPA: tRNA (guanosine(46)-N7)-methyltransferase TrmB [Bacillota bacterium]|nr:tRNA (guanosine(46)-N7)-methyltransferase TrmB [Bacillota bacterium]HPE38953.1 tRNA (guanosine(46)-N7)-methyltransferase TrmB [Bacillota bacterium]